MKRFKFNLTHMILLIALTMFMVISTAPAAEAAIYWKAKNVRFAATAGEILAVGDVVCIKGSDGKAYKADANDAALRPAVGLIGRGGASGATVEVVVQGTITGMTAQSPGARLFLSETTGAIVTTAPANAQGLGFVLPGAAGAASSTTYFIDVKVEPNTGAGY